MEKHSQENGEAWRKPERRRSKREKGRREKLQAREEVGRSRKSFVCPRFCGSGGSKRRLTKAEGVEPAGHRRDETVHAVVARSTFGSKKRQNSPESV